MSSYPPSPTPSSARMGRNVYLILSTYLLQPPPLQPGWAEMFTYSRLPTYYSHLLSSQDGQKCLPNPVYLPITATSSPARMGRNVYLRSRLPTYSRHPLSSQDGQKCLLTPVSLPIPPPPLQLGWAEMTTYPPQHLPLFFFFSGVNLTDIMH
jgi:hypothetical protein